MDAAAASRLASLADTLNAPDCSGMWRLSARSAFVLLRLPRVLPQATRECRILRASRQHSVLGISVRAQVARDQEREALRRLTDALNLVRTIDPRRFERLRRDLSYVVLRPTGGACYWVLSNACVLDLSDVLTRPASTTALMIVHEATHARLARAGMLPTARRRRRIEKRCLKEERCFTCLLERAGFAGAERLLAWLDTCIAAT